VLKKKELIHGRDIHVRCFETGEATILVEGSLTDERCFPCRILSTGETRGPGVYHHMTAVMEVSLPEMTILSCAAEMPVIPTPTCGQIKDSVHKVVGLQIRHGFTDTARLLIGYTEGCVHLMNLILAMASAAIQGAGAYFTRTRETSLPAKQGTATMDGSVLVNTCWLWREDGPLMQLLRSGQRVDSEERE
jgi:hypothetical protein